MAESGRVSVALRFSWTDCWTLVSLELHKTGALSEQAGAVVLTAGPRAGQPGAEQLLRLFCQRPLVQGEQKALFLNILTSHPRLTQS